MILKRTGCGSLASEAEGGDGVVKRGHGGEGGDGGDSGGGDACGSTRADAPSPTAQLPTATGARDSAKPFPMACLSVVARQAARIVSGSILSRHAARTCERAACVDIRGVVFYFHVYKGPRGLDLHLFGTVNGRSGCVTQSPKMCSTRTWGLSKSVLSTWFENKSVLSTARGFPCYSHLVRRSPRLFTAPWWARAGP